jgi:hypothetical protein
LAQTQGERRRSLHRTRSPVWGRTYGVPRAAGKRRTWPNVLTREGSCGHEYQIIRLLQPDHDVIPRQIARNESSPCFPCIVGCVQKINRAWSKTHRFAGPGRLREDARSPVLSFHSRDQGSGASNAIVMALPGIGVLAQHDSEHQNPEGLGIEPKTADGRIQPAVRCGSTARTQGEDNKRDSQRANSCVQVGHFYINWEQEMPLSLEIGNRGGRAPDGSQLRKRVAPCSRCLARGPCAETQQYCFGGVRHPTGAKVISPQRAH